MSESQVSYLLLAGVALCSYLFIVFFWKGYQTSRKSKIPWVSIVPFIVLQNPRLAIAKQFRECGPVILWSFFNFQNVVIGDAEIAKVVLKEEQAIEKMSPEIAPAITESISQSILLVNGNDWKRQREAVSNFMLPEMIRSFVPKFAQVASKMLDQIESLPEGTVVDFGQYSTNATLDVLGATILGYDFGALDGKLSEVVRSYITFMHEFQNPLRFIFPGISKVPFLKSNQNLEKASKNLRSLFAKIVKEKLESRKTKKVEDFDMTDVMLDAFLDSHNDKHLSEDELYHNLLIFFIAGHETTATALSWFLLFVAKYPDVQEKVFQEIQEVTGGQEPTFDHLKNLKYFNCVNKEVLRLQPPASLVPTRKCTVDTPIPGTDLIIPKGAMVSLLIHSIHHNPQYWENPEAFDPDRFTPSRSAGRHPFAFLPFSLGRRHCIGQPFSLAEQGVFLSMTLQRFKILPVGELPGPKSAILSVPQTCRLIFQKRK